MPRRELKRRVTNGSLFVQKDIKYKTPTKMKLYHKTLDQYKQYIQEDLCGHGFSEQICNMEFVSMC